MKKLSGIVLITLALVVVLTSATKSVSKTKKGWKGVVTYSISYDGDDVTPASVANSPKSMTVKIMDDKSSVQMLFGMLTITMIENPEHDLNLQLLEFGDKKFAIKKKLSEQNADSVKKFDINIDLVNESKIIAGYTCKKAVVTFTPKDTAFGEEKIFNFYYSPELGDENTYKGDELEGIPGLLLEYTIIEGDITVIYSATEVKKGGVSIADFLVPVDYKVVTEEELQKEFSE